MRWVCWMMAAGLALAVAGPAAGQVAGWGDQGVPNPYGAPTCGAPMYGLVPGCCEFPPNCCTNVWQGYCEDRARIMSRGERLKQWLQSKACGYRRCRGCTVVVTGECCKPECQEGSADAYYAPQPQEARPAADAAPAAPPRPAPLTPAIGRRLGYRPPITPEH